MVAAKRKCKKIDCFASDIGDQCLLKRRPFLGYCHNYYPKVKNSNNEVFLHLFHYHNLKTRKYTIIALFISTLSVCVKSRALIV